MALINKISNVANITFGGETIYSLPADTLLILAPSIVKTVDKPIANLEDILTYTVLITNLSLSPITNLPFADPIPEGSTYVEGSFKVNGTTVVPVITGDTLTYTIPTISILGVCSIQFQVEANGGDI